MATTYKGIDYGLGKANIDETGIRYGVIHQNEVLQAWADDSEPVYGTIECEKCNNEFDLDGEAFVCPNCGNEDFDMIETETYKYQDNDYEALSGSHGDIMILRSPYYTYAQFCSPCAPGAVYLMNFFDFSADLKAKGMSSEKYPETWQEQAKSKGFPQGYCFGHDWFEAGKAPYPVYDIKTGKRVAADGSLMD